MALTAEAQALIDQVKANTSAEQSAIAALKGLTDQITALEAQVASAGDTPEDKAALVQAVADLKTSAGQLVASVPQNTQPAPVVPQTASNP